MRNQIASEWRKLRTTRSAYGLLAGAVTLAGLAAWAMVATMHFGSSVALTTLPGFAEMMVIVPIFVVVLGHPVVHGRERGTARSCRRCSRTRTGVAWSPRRPSCWASRRSGSRVAASATVAVVSSALLVAQGTAITVSLASVGLLVVKAIAICVLWSAIGLGVGLTVPQQVAAIVGAILWLLVGESLAEMLASGVAKFLPGHAATSMLGIAAGDASLLAPLAGAVALIGWALGSVAIGSQAFARRDIA